MSVYAHTLCICTHTCAVSPTNSIMLVCHMRRRRIHVAAHRAQSTLIKGLSSHVSANWNCSNISFVYVDIDMRLAVVIYLLLTPYTSVKRDLH